MILPALRRKAHDVAAGDCYLGRLCGERQRRGGKGRTCCQQHRAAHRRRRPAAEQQEELCDRDLFFAAALDGVPEPPEETDNEWLWSPVVDDQKAGIST